MNEKLRPQNHTAPRKIFSILFLLNSLEPLKLQTWDIKYDDGLEKTKNTKKLFNNS